MSELQAQKEAVEKKVSTVQAENEAAMSAHLAPPNSSPSAALEQCSQTLEQKGQSFRVLVLLTASSRTLTVSSRALTVISHALTVSPC